MLGWSWAVAACGAGTLSSLAVRSARSSRKAVLTDAVSASARHRIVASSRAWNGGGHLAAVAEAAGGTEQRAGGCAAAVGAVAALWARAAQSFELRTGSEWRGGVQESACRAAAGDAGVDGVDFVVVRPNVQSAVRAKHGG